MTDLVLTRARVLRLAVPVMLAQAAIAATGVVDTAVMGLYGDKSDLAAVAIASVAFSFIYWGFGFLRMSTTGLVAQALGRDDMAGARATLQRGLLLGAAFGVSIFVLSPVLRMGVFAPFGAEPDVVDLADGYFAARVWGAPALLTQYAITGWLLGTGRTGALLAMQIVMNGVNIVLDVWFVASLGWGPAGIGAGTAIAEWVSLVFGLVLIWRSLKREPGLLDRAALMALFNANRDILIRTLALLFAFAWFVRSGAQMGTAQLAGNEVLLQFITVAAFVLDGFAFVAEKEVGEAYGARSVDRLRRAMRLTSELALAFGVVISLAYLFAGAEIIQRFISDPEARDAALAFLPYCAAVPLIGVAAFQLDGFFLGATQGRAMRNAGIVVTVAYVALDLLLRPLWGNTGVWLAFLGMYVLRAGALGYYLPSLMRATAGPRPQPQPRS
ncbi:MAG: MATE family efflux transporter [Hyphomonadaceae bacterium]|nr:MATE family efflux transporter [Hyphomonadaceae bacterium]